MFSKLYTWKYDNMSDNKVPNRDIKWDFGIPYLLKMSGSIFGFHGGFSFHIWFLCFGIDFITNVSCGKVNKIQFWKWYISFILRRGWSFEFHIGVDRMRVHDWKMKRFYKRLTPEQFSGIRKQLEELLV